MRRRIVVHDEMVRVGKRVHTWCGRVTTTRSLIHKRPNCKTCSRAVKAWRQSLVVPKGGKR